MSTLRKLIALPSRQSGLTVIELVIVIGITSIIITALIRFLVIGNPISRITFLQTNSTETARVQLKRISRSIREARNSDTGAYPLVDMLPQRIVYYANVDGDAATERVRYELTGTDLVRGITKPTGTPLVYNLGNEDATIVAANVVNGTDDIFTYYNGDYPADQTPLTPVDVTEVKYVQFRLLIDADVLQDPPAIEVRSQVQLRNLKTNLGEIVE